METFTNIAEDPIKAPVNPKYNLSDTNVCKYPKPQCSLDATLYLSLLCNVLFTAILVNGD